MAVRAKMKCIGKKWIGQNEGEQVVMFQAVATTDSCDVNKEWSRWTPWGEINMNITNPEATKQFEIGKDYFVDFSPA